MKIPTTTAILLCSLACLNANTDDTHPQQRTVTKRFHIIPTHTKNRETYTHDSTSQKIRQTNQPVVLSLSKDTSTAHMVRQALRQAQGGPHHERIKQNHQERAQQGKRKKKSNPLAANKKFCTKIIPHKKIGAHDEFAVASTLPNHGEIAITGKQVLFGTNLYFDKLKQEAANHTLPLFKFFYLDNNAEVPRARADLQELHKQSPALLNLYGTKIIVALEKQLRGNQWGAFFPIEGLDWLRRQDAHNTIYLRASLRQYFV